MGNVLSMGERERERERTRDCVKTRVSDSHTHLKIFGNIQRNMFL